MIELLRTRRSIRAYQDKKINNEHLEILKEALVRAPTSRDNQAWEFIFVDDKELLTKLSTCRPHGASFLKKAALAIVMCGEEKMSDVWIENCAIAATFAQLTAHSLGIGSCWIQIRKRAYNDQMSAEDYIRNLLKIPTQLRVASMVGLGYPAEQKEELQIENLKFEKIKYNIFK